MAKQFKGLAKDFINAMRLQFIGQGANANDIFVQDLFSSGTTINTQYTGKGYLDTLGKRLTGEDRQILESILKVYNENIQTKKELLTLSRQLFESSDIVQNVIDVMIDDGFNSFNNETEEFRIEYTLNEDQKAELGESFQEEVQNEIDEFVDKFRLKSRIAEIVPELLRDGEYAFGVLFEDKKGITELVDDLDVINILPYYEGDKVVFIVNQETLKEDVNAYTINQQKPPIVYSPENVIIFRLKGPTKKRLNMSCFYDSKFRKLFYEHTGIRLPKYIRMGLPVYASAMKLLQRLKLMEDVSTITDLSDILKPEIVHVTVPTNTSSEEAKTIIRDYERQLNSVDDLADSDSLDITTLASLANRRKILPQWMDTKGTLSSANIDQTGKSEAAWSSINNLRNLIALSIGIPPFYINISESPIDKAQTIKLYSRYTRKLTSLQKTLADGTKEFVLLHLRKKGYNISASNILVKFKAITSGDSLDDTDMMVATVTGINDLYKGIADITSSEQNDLVMDDEQFKILFDNLTSRYLNISNLIKIDKNKFTEGPSGEESEDDFGFEPSSSSDEFDFSPEESPSGGNEGGGDDAYNDFAAASDGITLEEPQEIETET